MAAPVTTKKTQKRVEVTRGAWVSEGGQLSFGCGNVLNEVLLTQPEYEDLKSKSVDERKAFYLVRAQERDSKKPVVEAEK